MNNDDDVDVDVSQPRCRAGIHSALASSRYRLDRDGRHVVGVDRFSGKHDARFALTPLRSNKVGIFGITRASLRECGRIMVQLVRSALRFLGRHSLQKQMNQTLTGHALMRQL